MKAINNRHTPCTRHLQALLGIAMIEAKDGDLTEGKSKKKTEPVGQAQFPIPILNLELRDAM